MSNGNASVSRKSLLEKYDIPIGHLDFDYIKSCNNTKEIEQILSILKSGEEGFYPDLTKCASYKLLQLNPESKVLREEHPVTRPSMMDKDQWQGISKNFSVIFCFVLKKSIFLIQNILQEWTTVIKEKDKILRQHTDNNCTENLPPIRKFTNLNITSAAKNQQNSTGTTDRIKSCDYDKWDKYDADTETLKIDLTEEINREKTLMENKKKENKLIEPIENDDLLQNLSNIEKENLAEK